MRVPEKFPAGCKFAFNSDGDARVLFPDGKAFGLAEDGVSLFPVAGLPKAGDSANEAAFMAESRALASAANR